MRHPVSAEHALDDDRDQGEHAQPLQPSPALERQEAARQDDRGQPDRGAVQPMDVLESHAERGVPEVVQEHVHFERRRPVGHGQADPIGGHRATHIQQRQSERGRQDRDPVHCPAIATLSSSFRATVVRLRAERITSGRLASLTSERRLHFVGVTRRSPLLRLRP